MWSPNHWTTRKFPTFSISEIQQIVLPRGENYLRSSLSGRSVVCGGCPHTHCSASFPLVCFFCFPIPCFPHAPRLSSVISLHHVFPASTSQQTLMLSPLQMPLYSRSSHSALLRTLTHSLHTCSLWTLSVTHSLHAAFPVWSLASLTACPGASAGASLGSPSTPALSVWGPPVCSFSHNSSTFDAIPAK